MAIFYGVCGGTEQREGARGSTGHAAASQRASYLTALPSWHCCDSPCAAIFHLTLLVRYHCDQLAIVRADQLDVLPADLG